MPRAASRISRVVRDFQATHLRGMQGKERISFLLLLTGRRDYFWNRDGAARIRGGESNGGGEGRTARDPGLYTVPSEGEGGKLRNR